MIYRFQIRHYVKEIEKRSKYSIFDYRHLAEDMELITKERGFNAFYGHDRIIKQYLHEPMESILECVIEHGPGSLTPGFNKVEFDLNDGSGLPVYVSSTNVQEILHRMFPAKDIIPIGLFIQYAESILNENELYSLKKELGRVLLVFPYHSSRTIKTSFSIDDFLNEIEQRGRNFDTVLICLYWSDILKKRDEVYLKKGYRIVSAGHIYDWNFLPRLRTIIELADMTMSNQIGTHVGYCICLNKPHYIFRQEMEYYRDSEGMMDAKMLDAWNAKYAVSRDDISACDLQRMRAYVYDIFGTYREYITEEEKAVVRKYWGEWKE